ncbi:MAG: hypothetical protein A2901_02425 [Elusimicrobia bacterium RIFCSPLOWO2_01_FULL_54_10]|nr:MAG: hypothetical protein A2901_02425 [Elusimicrobia bacterium RIFCSPLOWO2_01_FULL_54_10]
MNDASLSRLPQSFLSLPQWNDWQWQVLNQIRSVADLDRWISLSVEEKRAVQNSAGRFQFALTPYWVSLMDPDDFFCPIRRQSIPMDEELRVHPYEASDFKASGIRAANGRLHHSAADRAELFVHSQCAVYCRYCPQRKVTDAATGESGSRLNFATLTDPEWQEALLYLEKHPQIREVVITGGEPLLLNDEILRRIFSGLKAVPSIRTLRIETRVLSVLPQRITPELARILKAVQPVYLVAHVNHPREMTREFCEAARLLSEHDVPLAAETVLLKEINDKTAVLSELFFSLYEKKVRPYRLRHCIPSQGTDHFRTSIAAGLRLIESLRSSLPGLALPEYVAETLGGKIPLRTESVLSRSRKRVLLRNHEGKVFVYPEKVFQVSS